MQKLNQSVFSGLSQKIFPKLNNAYHLVIFIYWTNLSRMDRLKWLQRNYCRGSGSVSKRWWHMYAENVPLEWSFWSGQAGYLIWKERVFVQDIIRCSNFQKKAQINLIKAYNSILWLPVRGFSSHYLSFLIVFHLGFSLWYPIASDFRNKIRQIQLLFEHEWILITFTSSKALIIIPMNSFAVK